MNPRHSGRTRLPPDDTDRGGAPLTARRGSADSLLTAIDIDDAGIIHRRRRRRVAALACVATFEQLRGRRHARPRSHDFRKVRRLTVRHHESEVRVKLQRAARVARTEAGERRRGVGLRPPPCGIQLADAATPAVGGLAVPAPGVGRSLPAALQAKMERAFAGDFADVRVHEGDRAPALGAVAYAEGRDLHFAPGSYRPHSPAGQRLIGHELAHVVQQSRGMVAPTREVGGVPVNDSPKLERQADLAAERAARGEDAGLPAGPGTAGGAAQRVVQREIHGRTLPEVLAWQTGLQEAARRDPARYAHRYTTVGLEHEFGQMVDGRLRGVDHLELARSTAPRLPLCGLPFVLETDASNAVELVSPPFLLETPSSGRWATRSSRTPVPIAADVRTLDEIFRAALLDATAPLRTRRGGDRKHPDQRHLPEFIETPRTLAGVVAGLARHGVRFELAGARVEPYQLSQNTTERFDTASATIAAQELADIRVKPSQKGVQGTQINITTQINFATDARTADRLQRAADADASLRPGAEDPLIDSLRAVEADIRERLLAGLRPSPGLAGFYRALARTLAGQVAVPYMRHFRAAQEEAFWRRERMLALPGQTQEALATAEAIASHVKDTSGVWVKSMVVNLGLGVLTRAEWRAVRARLSDRDLGAAIRAAAAVNVSPDWPLALRAGTQQEIGAAVAAALRRVVELIDVAVRPDTPEGFAARGAGLDASVGHRLEFAQHDPRDVGPRQDTYIRASGVQTPLWDRRLHVVETRGETLDDQLSLLGRVAPGARPAAEDGSIWRTLAGALRRTPRPLAP